MPLRPTTKNQENRPISAIYIGKGSVNNSASSSTTAANIAFTQQPPTSAPAHTGHYRKSSSSSIPPGLPDLPEPPSPVLSNSSADSGLPSPPATNSTGSGSTGDPGRINMKGGAYDFLDGDVADDSFDEDTTARMRLAGAAVMGRHAVAAASSENVAALARVKNLAERNRQALDKLSSMARLAPSPSPASTRHSRTSSAALSVYSSSSSSQATSSRSSRPRISHIPSVTSSSASQDQVLSGSETEKESTPSMYAYHPNNSSPSLHGYTSSAVSSSPSSTSHPLPQTFSTNSYDASHAHTPGNRPLTPTTRQTMQQQSQPRSKHHRIASLASASTSHLPSNQSMFQTPPSQVQPISRTRSTGTHVPSGSSGGMASTDRMRQTPASSERVANVRANVNVGKRQGDGSTDRNSPGSRRTGSTNVQRNTFPVTEDEAEPANLRRRSTIKAEDKDVTQAALAAVASSRSRSSLGRRGTLPKEFRHEVMVEDNYAPDDPITPYRSKSSSSRDVLASVASFVREGKPSLRGGSAESALTTRGSSNVEHVGGRSVVSEVFKAVGLSPRRNRRLERENKERDKQEEFRVDGDVFREQREAWDPEGERVPISEFGERRTRIREKEREQLAHAGSRSATSLSLRRYSSRSRSRARTGVDDLSDEDSDDGGRLREEDVTRTAPAGLRAYRQPYFTPRDSEKEVTHLSLMKKEKEREWERGKESAVASGRSMTSLGKYSTPVHQTFTGPSSALKYSSHTPHDQERERAASRQSALASIDRTEHVRLMIDSLAMFEGHVSRMSSSAGGGSLNPAHISELVRTAESVVASADRLNGTLRAASKHAVEQEIDAEVADDMEVSEHGGRIGTYSAKDTAKMWRTVSADYKEGVKASDELVRGITTFLLGIGKFLRDVDTLEGGGDRYQASENGSGSIASAHTRSISLNDEDIVRSARRISPSLSGGSSGRDGSRRSVDISSKGWGPSPLAGASAREDALRRLTERSDGAPSVRTSSSVLSRERDQEARYESPVSQPSSRRNSAFITPASSRSSTALSSRRTHREQESQHWSNRLPPSESESLLASTSQDTITPDEPSPSPAPRIRDTSDRPRKNLPPLRTRPLPSLPPEASPEPHDKPSDNGQADVSDYISRMHERRKASQTSISTVRGVAAPVSAPYPAALNPSGGGATTAVTTHTVSNASPEATPLSATSLSMLNSESRRNVRSSITFSKPSTESVPTLAVLQQQYEERHRTGVGSVPPTPMSGSETERPAKRQTWGVRTGLKKKTELESFEDSNDRVVLGRAADRSAAATRSLNPARNERRTVTGLFPAS